MLPFYIKRILNVNKNVIRCRIFRERPTKFRENYWKMIRSYQSACFQNTENIFVLLQFRHRSNPSVAMSDCGKGTG